jgi:putative intracellular protease/amidase
MPTLTQMWLDEFVDHDTCVCSLCGNTGVLDTTGVESPREVPVGRKHYCICPNGRALKNQDYPL